MQNLLCRESILMFHSSVIMPDGPGCGLVRLAKTTAQLWSGKPLALSFPRNLGTKSLVQALLQGSPPPSGRGSFLEEARATLRPR